MNGESLLLPRSVSRSPLPRGWRVLAGPVMTLEDPEGDLRLSLHTVSRGKPEEVAAAALAGAKGRSARVLNAVEASDSSGWDAVQQVVFDTSSIPGSLLTSFHYLLGDTAFVAIVDGTTASFDRRMGQIADILESWKPPGRSAETCSGREAAWGPEQGAALDAFVRSAMELCGVPGAAIAVVLADRLVHSAAFGVTQAGGRELVSARTRFRIGSSTKALTTLMMAQLVEAGLFGWETPVLEVNPEFASADPSLRHQMQMRHTVNASTGMPRRDLALMFRFGGVTPEERLAELRVMAPTTALGEAFQYSNHLVALGGYVAAKAAHPNLGLGTAYVHVMQELVFNPLGMMDTFVSGSTIETRMLANPHAFDLEAIVSPLPEPLEHFVDSVAPSGGVWSTADDIAKYLLLELAGGKLRDGRQLLSAEALAGRQSGGAKITDKESYGLGLMRNTALGSAVLHHAGNTLGFTSDMFFVPDQGLGAVLLCNLGQANGFREAVRRRILELALDLDQRADGIMRDAAENGAHLRLKRRERIKRDRCADNWLDRFVGTYRNSALGSLSIKRTGDQFRAEFADFGMELGMDLREDACMLALVSPPFSGSLSLRPDESQQTLILSAGQEEYVFERKQLSGLPKTELSTASPRTPSRLRAHHDK